MAKTTKKANAVKRNKAEELEARRRKDDGTRWQVVRDGRPVYVSAVGVVKGEAERLRDGLAEPATIAQIKINTPS